MLPILLTAFDGNANSSCLIAERIHADCHKCILPNNKEQSVQILLDSVRKTSAVCVVMLGQKPCIRDKIAIEPTACQNGNILHTPLDCTITAEVLHKGGYAAYISKGCGNSYCNHLYHACLANGINGIFLHIPMLHNISDRTALTRAIEDYIAQIGSIPCAL